MKPITLILPPDALERIPVIRATEFLAGYGLTLDAEIRDGQIVMTARPIPDEATMRRTMENMETFTLGRTYANWLPPDDAA